ncbi:hypothetical protein [Silvanigrella aquatica]|uniref:Uncharacterized protein n=1 Tax=Silvanigrella aquatica TaxID=1915309 RepID=A0A1L4D1C1_9BACT|nr:hypothetical protein [Silvanigrella aquatica]APJ04005.1 hypothetical protein AXG55_08835 [Silvanigrella aquatica]
MKNLYKLFAILLFPIKVFAANPPCANIHVWYELNNQSENEWVIDINTLIEKNLNFYNDKCKIIKDTQKIKLNPQQIKYIGMYVRNQANFRTIVSFSGVEEANNDIQDISPLEQKKCVFLVQAYAPATMNRMIWQINNSDCYATNYNTKMYFK